MTIKHAKYFMTEELKSRINHTECESSLKLLQNVEELCIFPDYTPNSSLPTGTYTVVDGKTRIDPQWISFDVGCGYQLLKLNKSQFGKKSKLEGLIKKINGVLPDLDKGSYRALREENAELPLNSSMGTLGGGNHFIDFLLGDELYCLIHTGSRDFGYGIKVKFDRDESSDIEFNKNYLEAVVLANKFAKENRNSIRKKVEQFCDVEFIFDKVHNTISKNGSIHIQKGVQHIEVGELAVVAGNVMDGVYLVKGAEGLELSHGMICHGTGRRYSQAVAKAKFNPSELRDQFKNVITNVYPERIGKESPRAYRNLDNCIESLEKYKLVEPLEKLDVVGMLVER